MISNIYKIIYKSGSIIEYKHGEVTQLFKTLRKAKKCPYWAFLEDKKDLIISKKEAMKVDYLKTDIEKSVASITIKNKGVIESLMIMKVKVI